MMKLFVVFLFAFYALSEAAPKIRPKTCACSFFDHNATYQRCIQNGTIHLTFDDGPVPAKTDLILDLLLANNISATFFINGANYWPDLDQPETRATVRRAIREGHRVEHHTWSHMSLTSQSTDSIHYEMNTLSDKINEVLEYKPTLMRPPFGNLNNTVYDIVGSDLGYKFILWSICPCDWLGDVESSMDVYRETLGGTDPTKTPGFISLHHDPIEVSLELTRQVIEYVQTTDYRFVGMRECLGF